MLKSVKFPEANLFLPATTIDQLGKVTESNFHYYKDPKQDLVITCLEIDADDLAELIRTKKLYLVLPMRQQCPFTLQAKSPFEPIIRDTRPKHVKLNGTKLEEEKKDEGGNPEGSGDDQ